MDLGLTGRRCKNPSQQLATLLLITFAMALVVSIDRIEASGGGALMFSYFDGPGGRRRPRPDAVQVAGGFRNHRAIEISLGGTWSLELQFWMTHAGRVTCAALLCCKVHIGLYVVVAVAFLLNYPKLLLEFVEYHHLFAGRSVEGSIEACASRLGVTDTSRRIQHFAACGNACVLAWWRNKLASLI